MRPAAYAAVRGRASALQIDIRRFLNVERQVAARNFRRAIAIVLGRAHPDRYMLGEGFLRARGRFHG